MPFPILAATSTQYIQEMQGCLGKGATHARLLYQEWIRQGSYTGRDPHFRNAAGLQAALVAATDFSLLPILGSRSAGGTTKYLLQAAGGEIEMVLLPMRAGYTLCLSSQIGCRMGCAFCETGKMGLIRHLRVEEIVGQVFQARHALGYDVRNLVFMGMGEPLDNYEAVLQAISVLSDPAGFGIACRHITLSTSGLVPEIYRLIREADPSLRLAVSVNAPEDGIRERLMPVNKQYPMAVLREALEAYCAHPKRRILAEYVLIAGRNDSLAAADALAAYLRGLRVTVNLIPYNAQSRGVFKAPAPSDMEAFMQRMRGHGFLTFMRGTKGDTVMAACGQLGNARLRHSSRVA